DRTDRGGARATPSNQGPSMSSSQSTPKAPSRPSRSLALPLGFILLLAAAAGGYYWYVAAHSTPPGPVDELFALRTYLTQAAQSDKLAAGYTDANGDLVADPPTDPTKLLTVNELNFTTIA